MGLFSSKKPPKLKLQPVEVSTGFGTTNVNPRTGQYGYTLDPRLVQMRNQFYNAANTFAPTADEAQFAQDVQQGGQGMFGQGNELLQQALAVNPDQVANEYYTGYQNMIAPDRAREEARLADTLFRTGRTGAGVSYGDGTGYINPEQFALLKAREQQNQQIGLQAQDLGWSRRANQINEALGLQKTGIGNVQAGYGLESMPYGLMNEIFGYGAGIENLGAGMLPYALQANQQQMGVQQALQQNKASRQSGGFGGLFGGLLNAGLSAAGGWSGLGKSIGGLFSGGGGSSGGGSGYDFNPYSAYTPVGGPGINFSTMYQG